MAAPSLPQLSFPVTTFPTRVPPDLYNAYLNICPVPPAESGAVVVEVPRSPPIPGLDENNTYFSFDVEADGPRAGVAPGSNSVLSIGAVAFSAHGLELASFSVNLCQLPGQVTDQKTMDWWMKDGPNKLAFRKATEGAVLALDGFNALREWIDTTHATNKSRTAPAGAPVGLMWPVAADHPRIDYYWSHFYKTATGDSEHFLDFKCIDMRSFVSGRLGQDYTQLGRAFFERHVPRQVATADPHSALADARRQGQWFFNACQGRTF